MWVTSQNRPSPLLIGITRKLVLYFALSKYIFSFLYYQHYIILRVYLSKSKFQELCRLTENGSVPPGTDPSINASIGSLVFQVSPADGVPDTDIAMNAQQRKCANFVLGKELDIQPFMPTSDVALSAMTVTVDLFTKKAGTKFTVDADELSEAFRGTFCSQVFRTKQQLAMDLNGTKLDLAIESLEHADVGSMVSSGTSSATSSRKGEFGQLLMITRVHFKRQEGSVNSIIITGGEIAMRKDDLFRSDFDFEQMGIGGLDKQFKEIFRKAFASRIFPGLMKQFGTTHVRGILLYGPPGCGKTLIARQIGKILNAKEPKIVNGPEVLDKFVGGSEEKIRALFADAEQEQAEKGDNSQLHIIIFDEMDAIMKTRGSSRSDSGVGDSIVNQLLSKIDGVDSLNNILLIGMTNRKDMIDEAILRPGRLEVHIEITLPDEQGRLQILNIKTASMKQNKRISDEAVQKLPYLASETKNYTGAELEGLVRNATSFALSRHIDPQKMNQVDEKSIKVEWADFERALEETVPAFGNKDSNELQSYFSNGLCDFGSAHSELQASIERLVNQVRNSSRTPLLSVMLEGAVGCGKTAIAAWAAHTSSFPFVRMISPDVMIGKSDAEKCNLLLRIFGDSYRSPLSIIFIDDIERLIEFTPSGNRFSNTILQTLLILLRKIPQAPCRLMIIATSSIAHLLEDLQLTQAFNVTLHVSLLQNPAEFNAALRQYSNLPQTEIVNIARSITKPIGIKKLLMVLEMSTAESSEPVTRDRFLACLHTVGF